MGTGLRKLDTDWTTGQVIGAAIDVYLYLGPGMLEHTYEVCLEAALREREGREERTSSDPSDPSDASVSLC